MECSESVIIILFIIVTSPASLRFCRQSGRFVSVDWISFLSRFPIGKLLPFTISIQFLNFTTSQWTICSLFLLRRRPIRLPCLAKFRSLRSTSPRRLITNMYGWVSELIGFFVEVCLVVWNLFARNVIWESDGWTNLFFLFCLRNVGWNVAMNWLLVWLCVCAFRWLL